MKKAILIASALLASSTVFAATGIDKTEIRLDGFDSQAQAYEAGFAELADYQAMSEIELAHKFRLTGSADSSTLEIESAEVRVEQFATKPGEVQYRPVLEVMYSYDNDDS